MLKTVRIYLHIVHILYIQNTHIHIVVYFPKVATVESEKQPLLANGSETTFVSRQRLGKHASNSRCQVTDLNNGDSSASVFTSSHSTANHFTTLHFTSLH
jgi:hypothetical protein